MVVLAEGLTHNKTLTTLDLYNIDINVGSNNSADILVLQTLINALRVNTTLKELHLSGNEICDSGVQLLIDQLFLPDTSRTSLVSLHLYDCHIGNEGAILLT